MADPAWVYRQVRRIPPELVHAFAQLDVATIHESLPGDGLLEHEVGPIVAGKRVCGPAVTAHNAPADNLAMHVALDTTQRGDVLVVATEGDAPAATWGSMAMEAAIGRGLAGVVTDGFVRDVPTIRSRGFPVWAKGISPLRAGKQAVLGVNVPIVCAGVAICPGDLVVADDDGVVVVPVAVASDVLSRACARAERERENGVVLASGTTPFELHGMGEVLRLSGAEVVDGSYSDV